MLAAQIDATSPLAPWALTGEGWNGAAGGQVLPLAHPALEAFSLVAGNRRAFIVREKARGRGLASPVDVAVRPEEFDRRVLEQQEWPLDYLLIVMPARPGEPVTLRCGPWGVAPVHLVGDDEGLHLHWDAAKLYGRLREAPDFARMAFTLRHMSAPYSRRTLFPELQLLTERSTATWRPGLRPVVEYPPPTPHSLARRLAPDADVLGAFDGLMRAIIERWFPDGEIGPCELSGGLDSTTVAVAASKASARPLRTYGLIMPGPEGDAQALRRVEVIQAIASADVPLRGVDYPPFNAGERSREDAMLLSGEYYHEAMRAMLSRVLGDGATSILRGIGGDEIAQLQFGEAEAPPQADLLESEAAHSFLTPTAIEAGVYLRSRLDPAPQGSADRSVYEAMAACSTVYLRSGVWPRYPYATPELVEFTRRLPAEWRVGRRLQRRYLAQFGLSQRVWDPDPKENFLEIMHQGLRVVGRSTIERMFADSRLAAMGLVSMDGLQTSYRRYADANDWREGEKLLSAACLEAGLRAVEAARSATTPLR